MLGRDENLPCPERPPYGDDTFSGKDALKDTLERRPPHAVISKVAYVRKAHFLCVVL